MSSAIQDFHKCFEKAPRGVAFLASKFPGEMESFDIDANGRFKIVYQRDQIGNPEHALEAMPKASIKVNKVITGVIEKQSVHFDPDCVTVTVGEGFFSFDVSVTDVTAVRGAVDVAVKKFGYSTTKRISNDTIEFVQPNWKV